MKHKYYLIFGIIIALAIVGIIFSLNIRQEKQSGAFAPLGGFLFPVDDTYYLVIASQLVLGEQEIKRQTGLDDIYPPMSKPLISGNEAKNRANERFNENINEAKGNLENFDLQKCINDCESSGKTMIDKTYEQYCETDYKNYLQSEYDGLANAELKDPFLIYNEKGEPSSWRVSAVKDDKIIRLFDINPDTGVLFGGGGCSYPYDNCMNWFTEVEAKNILNNYLFEQGIPHSKIAEGRYISYKRIVPN